MFITPYLSTTELKLYGYLSGYSTQNFQDPSMHPKFKLLSDLAVIPMFVAGIIEGIVAMMGKRTDTTPIITGASGVSDGAGVALAAYTPAATALNVPIVGPLALYNSFYNNYYYSGAALLDVGATLTGLPTTVDAAEGALITALNTAAIAQTNAPIVRTGSIELPGYAYLPAPLRLLGGLNQFLFYFSEGAATALDLILATLPYRQYAMQAMAHGFYSSMTGENLQNNIVRFKTPDSFYIRDNIQEIPKYQDSTGAYQSYTINNLKRSDTVTIRTLTGAGVSDGPNFINIDKSLVTLGGLIQSASDPAVLPGQKPDFDNISIPFSLPIASHYGALKVRLRNQYGQLQSIKQIPITPCEQKIGTSGNVFQNVNTAIVCPGIINAGNILFQKTLQRSPIFFGGDTFINRYTEKNTMFFFYDWLYDQPDGFEYNYFLHQMIPSPKFGVNSIKYDISDLVSGISLSGTPTPPGTGALPTRFYNLDYYKNGPGTLVPQYYNYNLNEAVGGYPGLFGVKEAKFYLTNSAVRDFFVE
jgi:hypothetical protein